MVILCSDMLEVIRMLKLFVMYLLLGIDFQPLQTCKSNLRGEELYIITNNNYVFICTDKCKLVLR